MPELVNKLMSYSVLAYLEHVVGIEKGWAPPKLISAMESESPHIPRALQIQLFDKVLKDFGPEVLENSAGILAKNPKSPILFVFLNVETPLQAVEKMIRLKKYLHTLAEMEILHQDPHKITVRHFFNQGVPHPGEHLYAFGAMKNILETAGCLGLIGEKETEKEGDISTTAKGVSRNQDGITGQEIWSFSWSSFTPNYRFMEGLDEILTRELPVLNEMNSYSQRVKSILWHNFSERWPLDQIAEKLGYSTRSLQHYLKQEGTRYSLILSELREERARQLLSQTKSSITEIGFFLGFADTAHFSREFKAKTGMTPSDFRKKLPTQAGLV